MVLEFQNSGGVIINITATLSVRGAALQTHAGTAKAAIGNILYIYKITYTFLNRLKHFVRCGMDRNVKHSKLGI